MSDETPKWLTEFLEGVSGCFESIPGVVSWGVADAGEDGWEVTVFPAAVELEGKRGCPNASVDISAVLTWFDEKPSESYPDGPHLMWGNPEELTIGGTVSGHDMTLTLMLQAPDDSPAMVRILPGEGLSWEYIDLDQPRPRYAPHLN